jgi:hypothetical protein
MYGLSCVSGLEASKTGRMKIAAISAAALLVAGCGDRQMRANPTQQGTEQQVHLIWKPATNEWKVKLNGGPEVNPGSAKTTLSKGTGPTMFVVDIAGHPNASFKDPGGLTVWTGSKSAPQPGINSTQILGPVVAKDGKLVFFDLNQGDPVALNYGLHFNNGVKSVDPIIDNGGNN